MAEEIKQKEEKINCSVFCDRFVQNQHYRFVLSKKHSKEEKTIKEWEDICKKNRIEIKIK